MKTKVILKWEGGKNGNPILFFPEYSVNRGRIACYVRMGEHSEADLAYYAKLRNPTNASMLKGLDQARELASWYQANKCEPGETLQIVKRDSRALRAAREV